MFELISRLREPLSAAGRTNFRQVTALSCIVGVVRGLSLIAFIPAAIALTFRRPRLGHEPNCLAHRTGAVRSSFFHH